MQISTSFGTLNVNDPGSDQDNWVTIEAQSIVYDKNSFFINEFKSDFPDYTLLGSNDFEKYVFLSELCARNKSLRLWFAATRAKYSNTTQLPLYLQDSVTPEEYVSIQEKLLEIKDKTAVIINKRKDLAAKYAADLAELENEERRVVNETIGVNNILKIITLTTDSLPLSIQMLIQSYTAGSQDQDIADNRRRLAQEYLAKFKVALIKLNEEVDDLNIDDLVKEIELK